MSVVRLDKAYKVTNVITNKENGTQTAIVNEMDSDEKSIISGIPADVKMDENTVIDTRRFCGNPLGSHDLLIVIPCDEKGEYLGSTRLWKTETGYRHRTQEEKENTEKMNLQKATMIPCVLSAAKDGR